nr:PfkB family carbohydrate kinase [uncultured Mediterraneibacter sp.]
MGKFGPIDVIVLNSHGVGQVCHIKRFPRRGETLEATNWHVEEDGGKGATVSVALGRLGVSTGYIGKVGYDPWGDMGDQWMSESGVDTTYMYRDHSVSTGTGLILIEEDNTNTIIDGDSACQALTWEEIHAAIDAMKEAKVFITGFGMPFKKALDGAKIAKEEYGMTTLCNVSPLPSGDMGDLSYLDYMVLNDVEARTLCDLPEDSDEPMRNIAEKLRKKFNCKGVIITCNSEGSVILDGKEYWKISPTPVKAVDTIGAGDGYLAAVAANLVWGKSMKEATEWASKYAAYKVTRPGSMTRRPGCGYPQKEEVDAFMASLEK